MFCWLLGICQSIWGSVCLCVLAYPCQRQLGECACASNLKTAGSNVFCTYRTFFFSFLTLQSVFWRFYVTDQHKVVLNCEVEGKWNISDICNGGRHLTCKWRAAGSDPCSVVVSLAKTLHPPFLLVMVRELSAQSMAASCLSVFCLLVFFPPKKKNIIMKTKKHSKQARNKGLEKFKAGLVYETASLALDIWEHTVQTIIRKWKEFATAKLP